MDRRRFILSGGPAFALTTVTTSGCHRRAAQNEAPYSPSFFRRVEWEFVNAAVARLIPAEDAGPGALDAGVPEFIDRQMELPYGHGAYFYLKGPFLPNTASTLGYQMRYTPREIYRLGIEEANAAARTLHGCDFRSCSAVDQDRVLGAMEKGELPFSRVPSAAVFAQLLSNTREGYFADPLYGGNRNMVAWRWIGFPGARADFTDWIEQPGREYPFGPVSIAGQS